MSEEQLRASRTVEATPAEVFAMLSDPNEHQHTEPTTWVRDAITTDPITGVGDVFQVNMYSERVGGDYQMHNEVLVFEPDRAIAWKPGRPNKEGEMTFGGQTWRYDLEPVDGGTGVTITYDWSGVGEENRARFNYPPFPADFLDAGLESLATRVAERRAS